MRVQLRDWIKPFCVVLVLAGGAELHAADPACAALLPAWKLPAELKTRGKPRRARWEEVDKIVTMVRKATQKKGCSLTVGQIFKVPRAEIFFPLTNNILRTIPEASFEGVSVHNQNGEVLGQLFNIVPYQRRGGLYATRSYTLYYFQFRDHKGALHSSGSELLLDNFLVKWDEIKDRLVVSSSPNGKVSSQ